MFSRAPRKSVTVSRSSCYCLLLYLPVQFVLAVLRHLKMFWPHHVDGCCVFQRMFQMNQRRLLIWDGWMHCMSGYSSRTEGMFSRPKAISGKRNVKNIQFMHALLNVFFASAWSEEDFDSDEASFAASFAKKGSCAETARMFKLRRGLDQLDCIYQQKEHDMQKARYKSGNQQTLQYILNLESNACRRLYWNLCTPESPRGHSWQTSPIFFSRVISL